jgi:putative addiction module antidote
LIARFEIRLIVIIKQETTMPATAKILTIGSSLGVVLTKDVLAHLKVQKGDSLYISETPDGIKLTPYDQDFAEEMEAGRKVMRKHRDVLRKLAQ